MFLKVVFGWGKFLKISVVGVCVREMLIVLLKNMRARVVCFAPNYYFCIDGYYGIRQSKTNKQQIFAIK